MQNFWMIRAGESGKMFNEFKEKSVVAIGWCNHTDLSKLPNRQSIKEHISSSYPEYSQHQINGISGQIFRFLHEFQVGDSVVTYDTIQRSYLIGKVISTNIFDPTQIPCMSNYRKVKWDAQISRDNLSISAKNSLGAIQTLFKLPLLVSEELIPKISGLDLPSNIEADLLFIEDESYLLRDIQARSLEFIKDKLSKLDWEQMQTLVADILSAMGYKTRISLPGADRGKDIIASPDGFGFEQPRIVVEVKHRRGQMGAPEIRSFLGGRHKDDKGLYVSTGGFTKEARYEADRATIPVTLMDLDDLVIALIENYDNIE